MNNTFKVKTVIRRSFAVACVLVVLLFGNTLFAQYPAPVAAMPSEENRILIDSLLALSHYENFFRENCVEALQQVSKEQKWSSKTLEEKIRKINFAEFKEFTLYNAFSMLNKDQLEIMIIFFTMLGRERTPPKFYLVHQMSEANVKHYIKKRLLK